MTINSNRIEAGKENLAKFESWVVERTDEGDFLDYIRAGKLNRSEVAKELGFGRSVFAQNPAVKELALKLDNDWGQLKPHVPKTAEELSQARERANDKVKQTEGANSKLLERVAMLEAENRQLKLQIANAEHFRSARASFLEKVELIK